MTVPASGGDESPAVRIDTTVAHPARRYNYWLGGKDHFAADRESGEAVAKAFPSAPAAARCNRAFMKRAVEHLTREVGIRQFLDIGTGIPAPDNTHEVAQAIAPQTRVVYVDNDPIVMAHARALVTSTPQGRTAYLEADVRKPRTILDHPDLTSTLDLSQPVALMLVAVLHFVPDSEDPYGVVAELLAALPSGSYLVASHGTADTTPPELNALVLTMMRHGSIYPRTAEEFGRFFVGLELLEPGVVSIADWRPGAEPRLTPAEAATYAGVGRKP
jgi:hypothetical protein